VLAPTEGRHDVIAWVSPDAGVTWTQQTVVDLPSGGERHVHDLAATQSGLVLTGWWDESPDGDHHTYVGYSTDGTSWETSSSTDTEEITRIAAMRDTIIIVGDEPETHVWNAPWSRLQRSLARPRGQGGRQAAERGRWGSSSFTPWS
jgi:hypothetical protein